MARQNLSRLVGFDAPLGFLALGVLVSGAVRYVSDLLNGCCWGFCVLSSYVDDDLCARLRSNFRRSCAASESACALCESRVLYLFLHRNFVLLLVNRLADFHLNLSLKRLADRVRVLTLRVLEVSVKTRGAFWPVQRY